MRFRRVSPVASSHNQIICSAARWKSSTCRQTVPWSMTSTATTSTTFFDTSSREQRHRAERSHVPSLRSRRIKSSVFSDVPKNHPFLGTTLTVPSNGAGEDFGTEGHHQRGKRRRVADQRNLSWHTSRGPVLDALASVLGNLEVDSVSGKLQERSDGVLPSPVAANPPGKLTFRILPVLRNRLS